MLPENRKITPEKAVKIFAKHGINISITEAKLMLDFLYKFAKLTLETVLKQ